MGKVLRCNKTIKQLVHAGPDHYVKVFTNGSEYPVIWENETYYRLIDDEGVLHDVLKDGIGWKFTEKEVEGEHPLVIRHEVRNLVGMDERKIAVAMRGKGYTKVAIFGNRDPLYFKSAADTMEFMASPWVDGLELRLYGNIEQWIEQLEKWEVER